MASSASQFMPHRIHLVVAIWAKVSQDQLELYVEATDTIEVVRQAVQDKFGIPCEQQLILHGGRQLEVGRTFADYGITQQAMLWMIPSAGPDGTTTHGAGQVHAVQPSASNTARRRQKVLTAHLDTAKYLTLHSLQQLAPRNPIIAQACRRKLMAGDTVWIQNKITDIAQAAINARLKALLLQCTLDDSDDDDSDSATDAELSDAVVPEDLIEASSGGNDGQLMRSGPHCTQGQLIRSGPTADSHTIEDFTTIENAKRVSSKVYLAAFHVAKSNSYLSVQVPVGIMYQIFEHDVPQRLALKAKSHGQTSDYIRLASDIFKATASPSKNQKRKQRRLRALLATSADGTLFFDT